MVRVIELGHKRHVYLVLVLYMVIALFLHSIPLDAIFRGTHGKAEVIMQDIDMVY